MENPNYHLLKPVVTAKEMAEIDRKTIAEIGIPGMVLMENAGRKVVESIKVYLGRIENKKIIVVCGKGNNGGDGYVIARYLKNMGAEVDIYLLGLEKDIKGDARQNLEILKKLNIKVNSLPDKNN